MNSRRTIENAAERMTPRDHRCTRRRGRLRTSAFSQDTPGRARGLLTNRTQVSTNMIPALLRDSEQSRGRIGTRASLVDARTLHALRPARAMAFDGLSLGGFTMGAVDAPTKMDVSLDDIIKQVRAAAGPRFPRLARDYSPRLGR